MRDKFLLWCDAHPILAHTITVIVGLAYLWAWMYVCVEVL